jgi:predicted 2-oxoglutarate/Fe(II)-dependent dioxygenase YbiX
MPRPSFFQALGIFVRPHLIVPEKIAVVLDAVIENTGSKAAVASATGDTVNVQVRNADEVEIPAELERDVERNIHGLHDLLERHAGHRLAVAPPVSFLRYGVGGGYRAHRDRAELPSDPASRRRLSVVLFLNDARSGRGFSGGQLRFYGVLGNGAPDIGLAMEPEAGTLVAFDSAIVHDVAEITQGVRCSAVCWFNERTS